MPHVADVQLGMRVTRDAALILTVCMLAGCSSGSTASHQTAGDPVPARDSSLTSSNGQLASACRATTSPDQAGGTVTITLTNAGPAMALVRIIASVDHGGIEHDVSMSTMVPAHGSATRTSTWGGAVLPGGTATALPPGRCRISGLTAA